VGPLDPALAQVRCAVRAELCDVAPDSLVLVACSGGTDSMALVQAAAFVVPRLGLRAGLLTVDHGLHQGSAAVAAAVRAWGEGLGLHPCLSVVVSVGTAGGPEAAARTARHAAYLRAVQATGAAAVLLAHHRDDQAEQVLLGVARGSGTRALSGMPRRRGPVRRPLLHLPRTTLAASLQVPAIWEDPSNREPSLARARARHLLLPAWERELGPGIAAALARGAELCRDDADLLDELAAEALPGCTDASGALLVAELVALPRALRTRVLRAAALRATGGSLGAHQTEALQALVLDWHGQGPVALPHGGSARRDRERIVFTGVGGSAP
jgi:tRNA(Ile)-lysidine synthase